MMRSLVIVFLIGQCVGDDDHYKMWIPNTNFNNRDHWVDNKYPCESSTVKFSENLDAAVYFPKDVEVNKIILPINGQIIMNKKGSIKINGNKQSKTCSQDVVQFKEMTLEPWFKPSNWDSQKKNEFKDAIPPIEKVPCVYDNVIFPKESSVLVQYPEIPITMNSFTIRDRNLHFMNLFFYLMSETGAREFKHMDYQDRLYVLDIEENECYNASGCICQSNEDVYPFICSHTVDTCEVPRCLKPITPVGHCCELCGVYLLLEFEEHFNLNAFKKILRTHTIKSGGFKKQIQTHVSQVLHEGQPYIQVIFIEGKSYDGSSVDIGLSFRNKLLQNQAQYNITVAVVDFSGDQYYPGTQLKIMTGIIFGTLLAVLVFFTVMFFVSGYSQKNISVKMPNVNKFRPFLFARFENTADGDLEFRSHSVASSLLDIDRAFDNPLYEEPKASTSKMRADEEQHENFDIPLTASRFSELQREEAQESEE